MPFAVLLAVAVLVQAPPVHTTHYPRHGGQLFPLAGDTIHIEGTWPAQRVFRLYVYDVDSRPLPNERLRDIRGSAAAAGATSALVLREDEGYFEARLPTLPMPAEIELQLTLPGGASDGVYFIFPSHSDDRALTFALEPTLIPASLALTVAALQADVRAAADLLAQQQSAYAFGPAIRVRDHALSLERFLPATGESRARAQTQIREAVRIAWVLHVANDKSPLAQVQGAIDELRRAVGELGFVFGVEPR